MAKPPKKKRPYNVQAPGPDITVDQPTPFQQEPALANTDLATADKAFFDVPKVVQLGSSGLREYNGYIHEDFLVQLQGRTAAKIYSEMEANDAVVGAMLYACGMMVRAAKWRVDPADETKAAADAQEFVEGCLEDMSHSFSSLVEEITSMFTFGHAPFEIVYKVRGGPDQDDPTRRSKFSDGRIGIRKIALRSQDSVLRWVFDQTDGGLLGMVQLTETGKYAVIPVDRLLLFRTISRKNNPEGRSILRNSYVSYFRKKAIEDAEGRAALRAAGLVVLRIPGRLMSVEADAQEQQAYTNYQTLAKTIAKDQQGAVILPSDVDSQTKVQLYQLEYVVADGRRQAEFSSIVDRHNRAMAMSIMADFLFLGQSRVGSFALSMDKTNLFVTALGSYLRGIEDVFNRHLIPRLWDLNNLDPKLMPQIKASDPERVDLQALSAYILALAQAGAPVFPDDDLENYLREAANLPEKPEGDTDAVPIVGPNAAPAQTQALLNGNPPNGNPSKNGPAKGKGNGSNTKPKAGGGGGAGAKPGQSAKE